MERGQHNDPEREAIATLHVAAVQLQSPRRLATGRPAPVPAGVILVSAPDTSSILARWGEA